MNDEAMKLHSLELTAAEINSLEALENCAEESAMNGNDVTTFLEMVKSYLKEHPSKVEATINVTRNYTSINSALLQHRHSILSISAKAGAILD